MAASTSPPVSLRAFLQSIMPAPVFSLKSLTACGRVYGFVPALLQSIQCWATTHLQYSLVSKRAQRSQSLAMTDSPLLRWLRCQQVQQQFSFSWPLLSGPERLLPGLPAVGRPHQPSILSESPPIR